MLAEYPPPLQARLADDAMAALAEVDDIVMGDARAALAAAGTRRLVLVPHGVIHKLPLHALVRDGRILIEDFEVVVAPSASVYLHCEERVPVPETSPYLLLGVPDEAAPEIAGEVEDLARQLENARSFIGPEASRSALEDHGPEAHVIHIAAHARYVADEPQESCVELADGALKLHEVGALRLNPALVVLAACATGQAGVSEGEELFGLARSFLMAGARSLLTTLWRVDDEKTRRFMDRFYDALVREKLPVSRAYQVATLALREQAPHPFHWAPFAMMGAA